MSAPPNTEQVPGGKSFASEIARWTGLSPSHVGRVLRGDNRTNLDTAMKIAAALGISLDRLARHIYGENKHMRASLAEITRRRKKGA